MAINWKKIKTEYITTKISQRDLAEKYGVSRTSIQRKVRAEKWSDLRRQKEAKTAENVIQKAADADAAKLMRIGQAAGRALDVAVKALEDDKQFNRYIITDQVGGGATETHEYEFSKVDTRALKDLTAVIKELTGIFRDVYGLPTQPQAEAQRIAAERLNMDKEAKSDSTDNKVEIVISGEMEEWAK